MDRIERLGMALPINQVPIAGVQGRTLAIAIFEVSGQGALTGTMLSTVCT